MTTTVTVQAPAKINLFLEVAGLLDNGYHRIESIMHSIDLCDTLTITRTDRPSALICRGDEGILPADGSNLVLRAADAFFSACGIQGGADFVLEKRIPIAAGLAGGSTDAAAALRGLNRLYNTHLDEQALCRIGASIGADVPFCLVGGCRLAGGIGELLTPCPGLPPCHLVVAIGRERVSTKWAFARLDEETGRPLRSMEDMVRRMESGSLSAICGGLYNAFEAISPMVGEIKSIMRDSGAVGVLMSGSGPSVFGLYGEAEEAARASEQLSARGYLSFCANPLNG